MLLGMTCEKVPFYSAVVEAPLINYYKQANTPDKLENEMNPTLSIKIHQFPILFRCI
jgi:hypothetical protein